MKNKTFSLLSVLALTLTTFILSYFSGESYLGYSGESSISLTNGQSYPLAGSNQVARELDVKIRFSPLESDYSYGNILQTTSGHSGLRVELQPSQNLYLVSHESRVDKVCDRMVAGKSYEMIIKYSVSGQLSIDVSGPEHKVCSYQTLITGLKVDDLIIASGLQGKRSFSGRVTLESINISYSYEKHIDKIIFMVNGIVFAIITSLVLLLFISSAKSSEFAYDEVTILVLPILVLALIYEALPARFAMEVKWYGYTVFAPLFLYKLYGVQSLVLDELSRKPLLAVMSLVIFFTLFYADINWLNPELIMTVLPSVFALLLILYGLPQAIIGCWLMISAFQLHNFQLLDTLIQAHQFSQQVVILLLYLVGGLIILLATESKRQTPAQ